MTYVPKQGEIIILDFNPQSGHEQKGRRPALVVSNNAYNHHCKMALVCPITNTNKKHPFHIPLNEQTKTTGVILCDQVRALDINSRNAVYKERVSRDILDEAIELVCSFVE